MNFLTLLLTALLSTWVSGFPTPRDLSQHARRDENSTLLDMVAQYKDLKNKAAQFLAEADDKKLSIEKTLGFANDSISTTSAHATVKMASTTIVAETYTVLTATPPAVVFVHRGTTRTASLNSTAATTSSAPVATSQSSTTTVVSTPSLTAPQTPQASSSASPATAKAVGTIPEETYSILTGIAPTVVFVNKGATTTVSMNVTATSASTPATPVATSGISSSPTATLPAFTTAMPQASSASIPAAGKTSNVPVETYTVLSVTGPALILASEGTTRTVSSNFTATAVTSAPVATSESSTTSNVSVPTLATPAIAFAKDEVTKSASNLFSTAVSPSIAATVTGSPTIPTVSPPGPAIAAVLTSPSSIYSATVVPMTASNSTTANISSPSLTSLVALVATSSSSTIPPATTKSGAGSGTALTTPASTAAAP
ncbi:hypothetical protein H0H93_015212 [Arthromyces matolae]|nr:hypothetical protein H0H93_015212 [Arthromyces matolae]